MGTPNRDCSGSATASVKVVLASQIDRTIADDYHCADLVAQTNNELDSPIRLLTSCAHLVFATCPALTLMKSGSARKESRLLVKQWTRPRVVLSTSLISSSRLLRPRLARAHSPPQPPSPSRLRPPRVCAISGARVSPSCSVRQSYDGQTGSDDEQGADLVRLSESIGGGASRTGAEE